MTKRQLIDEIITVNRSATPGFLAKFDDCELDEYLRHLRIAQSPRLTGDPHRFDHYFENCPTISVGAHQNSEDEPLPFDEEFQQLCQPEAEANLEIHVSPKAYFEESYEAKAS